jgi:hypothetical protein
LESPEYVAVTPWGPATSTGVEQEAAPALTVPEQSVVPPVVTAKVTVPVASEERPDAERVTVLPYVVLAGLALAVKDGAAFVMEKLVDAVEPP